jgi:cell division protein FtsI/penicillin-binding protein 2
VIVQEVATGAVLVLSQAGGGADTVDVARPLLPASLWKLGIAAAWWERGWGSEEMECPASSVLAGVTVRSPGAPGRGPLRVPEEMLVHSCNAAAVEMALRLGRDGGAGRLAGELRAMGFPVARPGERPAPDAEFWAPSAVPAATAPLGATVRLADDSPAALKELALGMERARVTPLHLSRFLQAVGNGGVMRAPTLAAGPADVTDGRPGRRVMSAATAARLQGAMRQAVDHGTARAAAGTQPGAWRLGGKTGRRGAARAGRGTGGSRGWSSTARVGRVTRCSPTCAAAAPAASGPPAWRRRWRGC